MAQAPAKQAASGFNYSILVIPVAFIIAEIFFHTVAAAHVDAKGDPLKNPDGSSDYMGLVHAGGFIVPLLLTMLLVVFAFAIERFLTINKAYGSGSLEVFLQKIKTALANNDTTTAAAECNKQKGSVANVVLAGLHKYDEMDNNKELEGEKKVLAIQKEIEEATSLELPMLQQNLPVIATIASVGTLVALLGTVLGMIRSFAALASTGSPDPSKLSAGISEALVNTAIGIGTSAIAIIAYSYFSSRIDALTYAIDEMGFSIAQSFASRSKK
jgi:biopolymer transport protein ExbB